MFDKMLGVVYNIAPFIIVLTIVVFVHEMGHFLIARYNGVHVRAFSIGYGPEIFGWTDKKGTRWRLSWIPFGGYVMMLGDADAASIKSNTDGLEAEELKKTLTAKTPLQKMMVAFGGPLANIIFTLLAFVFMGVFEGIPEMKPQVKSVVAESIAQKCGLQDGDVLTGINGDSIQFVSKIKELLEKYAGKDVALHYKRNGEDCTTSASLYVIDKNGMKTPARVLGINFAGQIVFLEASLGEVVLHSLQSCWFSAVGMVSTIFKTITGKSDG
jgi:regulator of sigma E protease